MKHQRKPRTVAPHCVAVAPLHALAPASGPDSNTGLASNSQAASKFALCVDYCTFVFSGEWAEKLELNPPACVDWLFPDAGSPDDSPSCCDSVAA